MSVKRVTNDQILEAINAIGAYPAKIADAVGLHYQALWKRIKANPELQNAFDMKRERKVDRAVEIIDQELEAGSLKAAMFVARTLGKDRGYNYRDEVTGENGAPIRAAIGPDLTGLSDEQIKGYLARLAAVAVSLAGGNDK